MKKRVYTLLRVSSKHQLKEEDIPVQRAECQKFLENKQNWNLEKEYIEPGVSGYKVPVSKRKVLQQIIEDAGNNRFDILLVYMSDRIGRREDEIPSYVTKLNQIGIEVWSVREGELKTEEHVDKLINYIRFWQAEGESRKIAYRVKDAQEAMAREGKFTGGNAPYGYQLLYSGEISSHGRALKKLTISKKEAEIVQEIYYLYVHLEYGYQKIANTFNEKKVPAIHDYWRAETIGKILQNPIYMGYFCYGKRCRNGYGKKESKKIQEEWIWPQNPNPKLVIISEEQWNMAQMIREKRRNKKK